MYVNRIMGTGNLILYDISYIKAHTYHKEEALRGVA